MKLLRNAINVFLRFQRVLREVCEQTLMLVDFNVIQKILQFAKFEKKDILLILILKFEVLEHQPIAEAELFQKLQLIMVKLVFGSLLQLMELGVLEKLEELVVLAVLPEPVELAEQEDYKKLEKQKPEKKMKKI